jgi:hypothetical protein
MATIEIILVSITAIVAIAGIIIATKTIIDTRKRYYNDFIEKRKNKKRIDL